MTTYKDLQPLVVKDTPFIHIGAQDLCSLESNWTGSIRKEGILERGLKRLGSLSKITSVHWRQYYVVLSQGCVYVFHDESSRLPKISFSLKHYKKLQRNFNTPYSFAILPSSEDGKIYRFCCQTDTERLNWMRALYVSLLVVHNQPVPRHAQSIGKKEDYDLTESEIVTSSSTSDSKVYEVDDDSSDDDGRYDKPEDVEKLSRTKNKYERDPTFGCSYIDPSIPPPPPPDQRRLDQKSHSKQEQSNCKGSSCVQKHQRKFPNGSVKTNISEQKSLEEYSVDAARSITTRNKPKVAPKPVSSIKALSINKPSKTSLSSQFSETLISENPKEEEMYMNMRRTDDQAYVQPDPKVDPSDEYMFDGDKYDTGRVLYLKPKGTFLIRPSAEPGKKVLVVKMANVDMLSFKIHTQESKLFIEMEAKFDTISQFVEHYKKHNLPKKDVTLGQGYNEVEDNDSDDYEPVEKPLL